MNDSSRGAGIASRPPLATVAAVLQEAGLPTEDLTAAHCEHFFSLGSSHAPEGVVGLELLGEVALLRSLAVPASQRGKGAGSALLAHAERFAAERGVEELYLLTVTAEVFFAKRGYRRAPRDSAPAAIRGTREFGSLCPASAAFMSKRLQVA